MAFEQKAHRAGPLKQANKAHKTGRHRSKGTIDKELKGKVSLKTITHKYKQQQRKEQRRNQANQIRKNKRDEALNQKRQIGGVDTSPFLICILPLHSQIDPKSALAILEHCDEEAIVEKSLADVTYITLPRFKQRFCFIIPPIRKGSEIEILDFLKVCDTTLLLTSATMGEDDIVDKWGHKVFNMISAQRIPTPIVALMDLESINPKKRQSAKSAVQKFVNSKLLPDEKIAQLDSNAEGINILRKIGQQKRNILLNKANRPHLFAEKLNFSPKEAPASDTGTLEVTGFLRGIPLDVNGLVHIPGLGDFQMSHILANPDPYKVDNKKSEQSNEIKLVAKADPLKQIKLQKENIPDEMNAEQTWPTEAEIEMANEETKKIKKLIKRVPKGMSDYQACWIPDVEEIDDEDDEDDEDCEDMEDFMSCESDEDSDDEMEDAVTETGDDEQCDIVSVSEAPVDDENYDQRMDLNEERETLEKIKEARVDQLYPDEIDTPFDIPARERLQKYRGLESFRTSPWDVKENLPSDYARIYQFKNFDRTKKRIISEAADIDGVMPGWYITIFIRNVNIDNWAKFTSARDSKTLVVYGILPHEHQMSIMNVLLKRIPDSDIPMKSKEQLIIQCGYRRFVVNPIFSQHTNGDKHKYERFFRPNSIVVATFYAPIQFPPAPVLCFKENPDSSLALMAKGNLLSCNPDRVVLKRIVLSGHPMRINRKSATIRYMFFNKEDVNYFKPIKLRTKCGRLGHIRESLGTHGHMKCIFDGQLRSYDTVFLYLYKRVFPKWNYEECIISCKNTNDTKKMEE